MLDSELEALRKELADLRKALAREQDIVSLAIDLRDLEQDKTRQREQQLLAYIKRLRRRAGVAWKAAHALRAQLDQQKAK